MADFEISYQQYLDSVKHRNRDEQTESGQAQFTPISEEDWEALDNPSRYYSILTSTPDPIWKALPIDEETAAAFRAKYGDEPWEMDTSGRPDDKGKLFYGYGDPRQGVVGDGPEQFAIDPSRIMYLPDGRWVIESSNVKGEWLAQDQATDDRTSNQHMTRVAVAVAGMIVGGAMMGGGEAAAGDTLASAPGQGFGTQGSGFSSYGGATPAPVGTAPSTGSTPDFSNVNSGGSTTATPGSPSTGAPPGAPSGSGAPPAGTPSGPPAGTPTTPPAGTPTTPPATTGPGNGIINTVRDGYNGVTGWYNNLSAGSRYIVNAAIGQGVNAIARSSAQRDAEQAQEEADQRQRDDRVRRGSVPSFGSAFTPKPGILGSRRGG